jgi:hypothetical protein
MIIVKPQGNSWVVTRYGTTHSNHRKKRPAVNEARRVAQKYGDTLQIMRQNGTIQRRTSYGGM